MDFQEPAPFALPTSIWYWITWEGTLILLSFQFLRRKKDYSDLDQGQKVKDLQPSWVMQFLLLKLITGLRGFRRQCM